MSPTGLFVRISVCVYVCLQLSASVGGVKEVIVEKQRDVNRVMTPVVQNRMITGYEACNLEKGPGMYERMKSHMSRHVDTTKSVMFSDASEQLVDQLNMLQVLKSDTSSWWRTPSRRSVTLTSAKRY